MQKLIQQYTLIIVLIILPISKAMAESLMTRLLRFSGITITSSKVRGTTVKGNLWVINFKETNSNSVKKITTDGSYHTPLWIQGSNKMLAVKQGMLVQLNMDGSDEKELYNLPDSKLHGLDKVDSNTILITQKSEPAILSLNSGKITPIPYDNSDLDEVKLVNSLTHNDREYGKATVKLIKKIQQNPRGVFKEGNKNHNKKGMNKLDIKINGRELTIVCPASCEQPDLNVKNQLLVFVGR